MTTILAITGDWHVNDTNALCPSPFRRERESYHRLDKYQRAILRAWNEYWEKVEQYKSDLGATVVCVHNGDLGDLNKHSKAQLISPLESDVKTAMIDVAKPALDVGDYHIVIRGTEAHTGGCGKLEEWFADDIGAEQSPDGTASWWVWRAEIEGVRVHVTHHPPTGTKLVSKRSQAVSRMCERLAAEHSLQGWKKPHLAFWSHIHWSARGHEMGIEGWTVPPWKGLGSFGYRIGISVPGPVGGLIVILEDKTWQVEQFLRTPPRIAPWTLPS